MWANTGSYVNRSRPPLSIARDRLNNSEEEECQLPKQLTQGRHLSCAWATKRDAYRFLEIVLCIDQCFNLILAAKQNEVVVNFGQRNFFQDPSKIEKRKNRERHRVMFSSAEEDDYGNQGRRISCCQPTLPVAACYGVRSSLPPNGRHPRNDLTIRRNSSGGSRCSRLSSTVSCVRGLDRTIPLDSLANDSPQRSREDLDRNFSWISCHAEWKASDCRDERRFLRCTAGLDRKSIRSSFRPERRASDERGFHGCIVALDCKHLLAVGPDFWRRVDASNPISIPRLLPFAPMVGIAETGVAQYPAKLPQRPPTQHSWS